MLSKHLQPGDRCIVTINGKRYKGTVHSHRKRPWNTSVYAIDVDNLPGIYECDVRSVDECTVLDEMVIDAEVQEG